jgi:putative transposase
MESCLEEGQMGSGHASVERVVYPAYNRRHDRVAHLFLGQFTAILVEKDAHLLALCRYVVLNTVRAKLVPHPQEVPLVHVCSS